MTNRFALPQLPWQDVVSKSGDEDAEALPRGCLRWTVTLYAWTFTFLILLGASHGVTFVGLHLLRDDAAPLKWWHWFLLVVSLLFFTYVEAFQGFHKSWSPWVARRCFILGHAVSATPGGVLTAILGPFFVTGFFFASKKRLLISYTLYPGIVGLVVLVKHLESPYHEIVDLGVAAGIGLGTLSFLFHFARAVKNGRMPVDVDGTKRVGELEERLVV